MGRGDYENDVEGAKHPPEHYDKKRVDNKKEKREWTMAGQGEVTNFNCGDVQYVVACTDTSTTSKRAVKPVRWRCDRGTCPDCFDVWARKTANQSVRNLMAVASILRRLRKSLSHVTISMPPEMTKYLTREKGRLLLQEDFLRVCRAFDMDGLFVLHPWRGNKEKIEELMDSDPENEDAIRDALLQLTDDELAHFWREGVHVHFVGYVDADFIKQWSSYFYRKTGVLVKVIASDMDQNYATNVVAYALTHAGIGTSKNLGSTHAITWVGRCAHHSKDGVAKLCELTEKAYCTCSDCHSKLHRLHDLDHGNFENPSKATLKDVVMVPRSCKAEHERAIEGMSEKEIREYVMQYPDVLGYGKDIRETEVKADFVYAVEQRRMYDEKLQQATAYPWKKSTESGQTVIDNSVPAKLFRERMRKVESQSSEDYERYCDERDEWLDEYNRQHGTSLRV